MPRTTQVNYDDSVPSVLQTVDWTCSACSLAWLNRSLFIEIAQDEWSSVDYIGTPTNINSEWGLMDASGSRLAQCLSEQGAPAYTAWLSWSATYRLASQMPLLIGGTYWCHWTGVRGVYGNDLLLANPAPGWMGVDQVLGEQSFLQLGPFAVVAVPIYAQFPPLPESGA